VPRLAGRWLRGQVWPKRCTPAPTCA
jgi:hypothetical protein